MTTANLVPDAGKLAAHAANLRPEPLRLPDGRTEEQAVAVAVVFRQQIWARGGRTEDQKIAELERLCVKLCCNHRPSGKRLASMAIWRPS